jgi:hypothetical protein
VTSSLKSIRRGRQRPAVALHRATGDQPCGLRPCHNTSTTLPARFVLAVDAPAIAPDSTAPCMAASNVCSRPPDLRGDTLEPRRDGANLLGGQRSFAEPHGEHALQVAQGPTDLGPWATAVGAAGCRKPCDNGVDDRADVVQEGGALRGERICLLAAHRRPDDVAEFLKKRQRGIDHARTRAEHTTQLFLDCFDDRIACRGFSVISCKMT